MLWLHWSGLLMSVEHFRAASLSRSAKECPCLHRLQLGTPVHIDHIDHIDHIQSLNSTTEIHWDPLRSRLCNVFLPFGSVWCIVQLDFCRLPGVSVSFEELTEAETPCRVTSWPWLIWLIGHYRIYRIYRGLDYVILSWISCLIDVYSVLSSPTMEIPINKAL